MQKEAAPADSKKEVIAPGQFHAGRLISFFVVAAVIIIVAYVMT